MADHSERYEKGEFEATANILLNEKDGDLRKINANMVAKRMGRPNANKTAYHLFDAWAAEQRRGRHIGNFSISSEDKATLDDMRKQLENMLIGIGGTIATQANRNIELQLGDLKDEVAGLKEDRIDLLAIIDLRDTELDVANKKIATLESQLDAKQVEKLQVEGSLAELEGRYLELRDRKAVAEPVTLDQIKAVIASLAPERSIHEKLI